LGRIGFGTRFRKIRFGKRPRILCTTSAYSEDGQRVFPDVVINLPDGKKMIVDSKVSLTAYEKYSNEEDETKKAI
jgi:DNA anti-recombination protein RmuC